jgi:hypothetical protein
MAAGREASWNEREERAKSLLSPTGMQMRSTRSLFLPRANYEPPHMNIIDEDPLHEATIFFENYGGGGPK